MAVSGGSVLPRSSSDKVVCRECYDQYSQITASHLSMHGMTTDEYRNKYPDAPFQSEEVRDRSGWSDETHGSETKKRISESIKKKHENGDYSSDEDV